MSLPNFVDAVVNERTEKWFIVLDHDVGDNKMKVINPLGGVLDVVKLIFKQDERRQIPQGEFVKYFSKEQIDKLATWEKQEFEDGQRRKLDRAAKASQQTSSGGAATRRLSASSSGSVRDSAGGSMGSDRSRAKKEGLIDRQANLKRPVVQWSAPELTFYRHRIDSLKPNDVFAIVVDGVGTFQITKAEFQRSFNNVVLNSDYRTQGVFRYDSFPEEARKFLV